MKSLSWAIALTAGIMVMSAPLAAKEAPISAKVLVIGHRGASARRPEHTLAS